MSKESEENHLIFELAVETNSLNDNLFSYYARVALGLTKGRCIRKSYARKQCIDTLQGRYRYVAERSAQS
jgi:hypothetical protein